MAAPIIEPVHFGFDLDGSQVLGLLGGATSAGVLFLYQIVRVNERLKAAEAKAEKAASMDRVEATERTLSGKVEALERSIKANERSIKDIVAAELKGAKEALASEVKATREILAASVRESSLAGEAAALKVLRTYNVSVLPFADSRVVANAFCLRRSAMLGT